MKEQKQVCDIRPGKRMTVAQSNEHLRIGNSSAWNAKRAGMLDPTRTHLNFEIGKGGMVKEVDQGTSIPKRILAILEAKGIKEPNSRFSDEDLEKPGIGIRTYANIILNGSTETMRRLAFGEQDVNYNRGADNSQVRRCPEIEQWATDMYQFVAKKYGEENIAAFVVHLDESNPHIHCTLLPITPKGKLSYKYVFTGEDKYEYARRTKQLHDELAVVNEKWGLKRGDSVIESGAQHKSYLQWLQEQVASNKETISQQATTIDEQKQQLYAINADIAKAVRKIKGLTTMLANLEKQKHGIKERIDEAKKQNEDGIISGEELESITRKLFEELSGIDNKIEDKQAKLEEARTARQNLAQRKHELQEACDELQRKLNTETAALGNKTLRDMDVILWEEATHKMPEEYAALEKFSEKLSPPLKAELEELLESSFMEDIAKRGQDIAVVATSLCLGFLDQATGHAQDCGGGSGGSPSDWRKKEDEDDLAYMRRCCIMGRMMMRPASRKLKR